MPDDLKKKVPFWTVNRLGGWSIPSAYQCVGIIKARGLRLQSPRGFRHYAKIYSCQGMFSTEEEATRHALNMREFDTQTMLMKKPLQEQIEIINRERQQERNTLYPYLLEE